MVDEGRTEAWKKLERENSIHGWCVWVLCPSPLQVVWLPGLRATLETVELVALKENARRNLSEGLLLPRPGAGFKLRLSPLFPA